MRNPKASKESDVEYAKRLDANPFIKGNDMRSESADYTQMQSITTY